MTRKNGRGSPSSSSSIYHPQKIRQTYSTNRVMFCAQLQMKTPNVKRINIEIGFKEFVIRLTKNNTEISFSLLLLPSMQQIWRFSTNIGIFDG